MIPRRTVLILLGTLLGGALTAATPPGVVCAQDARERDEGRRKREKSKEEEKTPEEKELAAIGKDFKDKDVEALIARVPEKAGKGKEGKLRLRLGKDDGTFKRTQAQTIIERWLESRTITRVKLKSTKDLVGTFVLKYRRRGKETELERTLLVRIAEGEGEGAGFVLKELEVQAQ